MSNRERYASAAGRILFWSVVATTVGAAFHLTPFQGFAVWLCLVVASPYADDSR